MTRRSLRTLADRKIPVAIGDGDTAEGYGTLVHLVGPAGSLPADHQFAVALTGLWHAAARAGDAAGFGRDAERTAIAPVAAETIDGLRRGRSTALAVTHDRTLVAFGLLIPGVRLSTHTGEVGVLLAAEDRPDLSVRLLDDLAELARDIGLDRLTAVVPARSPVLEVFSGKGFAEWGRRPGWIRSTNDLDELVVGRLL